MSFDATFIRAENLKDPRCPGPWHSHYRLRAQGLSGRWAHRRPVWLQTPRREAGVPILFAKSINCRKVSSSEVTCSSWGPKFEKHWAFGGRKYHFSLFPRGEFRASDSVPRRALAVPPAPTVPSAHPDCRGRSETGSLELVEEAVLRDLRELWVLLLTVTE